MLTRDQVIKKVQDFKIKHGVLDERDENIVATLHLTNIHKLDLLAAQDQTSRGGNDHGIDAWHYDAASATLTLYQSKLSTAKGMALKGFESLIGACRWLGDLLRSTELDPPPTNTGIRNLARCLADANTHETVRNVRCVLISPFDANELDDAEDFEFARTDIAKSELFTLLQERGGSLDVSIQQYALSGASLVPPKSFTVVVRENTSLSVGNAQLHVVLISLQSMIELFRGRGNLIFEKNVRLYLNTKEAKARLEHPMEETLEQICSGKLDPNMFTFYHVGVTLSATASEKLNGNLSLDAPYIINGCQTVNIASRYLAKLEKAKALDKIDLLRKIYVAAKVVIRARNDELREIANCNNRQNPIETWQLFSNDPTHVEIEASLRDVGVFYERQKGRYKAEIGRLDVLQNYRNTNGIFVTVEGLGQVICLCTRQLKWAAKQSEIFVNKERHDLVFTRNVWKGPYDIIWSFNAHKAVKRALHNYLKQPTLDNDQTRRIFNKPLVKQTMYYIAMMYLYQRRQEVSARFIYRLNRNAAPTLVDEAETCYRQVVKKTKDFYLTESKNLEVEVSSRKMEGFLGNLCTQIGLDSDGPMPFTERAIEWEVEQQEGE